MAPSPPLPTLLSHALVAFTIELDNAFEQRMPHRTTRFGGPRGGPWAVSLRQWSNYMRAVDAGGVNQRELQRRTAADARIDGMRRWGYIRFADRLIAPTATGVRAQQVWAPLPAEIEDRWRDRFGGRPLDRLRDALLAVQPRAHLPEWPTFTYGGYAAPPAQAAPDASDPLPLSALLGRALHGFALAYEQRGRPSLQYTANLLVALADGPVALADLPRLTGVAIERQRTMAGLLAKHGGVELQPAPGGRGQAVRLTDAAARFVAGHAERAAAIEQKSYPALRAALEPLVAGDPSPLWAGLEPPPGSWRSKVRPFPVLPAFPAPRQGGHPDGT